jgi:hypothetical protein
MRAPERRLFAVRIDAREVLDGRPVDAGTLVDNGAHGPAVAVVLMPGGRGRRRYPRSSRRLLVRELGMVGGQFRQ